MRMRTCISDEGIIKTGQLHRLYCEDIHSHLYLLYICQQEHGSSKITFQETAAALFSLSLSGDAAEAVSAVPITFPPFLVWRLQFFFYSYCRLCFCTGSNHFLFAKFTYSAPPLVLCHFTCIWQLIIAWKILGIYQLFCVTYFIITVFASSLPCLAVFGNSVSVVAAAPALFPPEAMSSVSFQPLSSVLSGGILPV